MRKIFTASVSCLLLLFFSNTCIAQHTPVKKDKYHFGQQQDEQAGYTQAIKVGNTIYVSGTIATSIDSAGITQLYNTIKLTLQHYGATLRHVVKENLYTIDIEAMKANNRFRKIFYQNDYPAATWVQVSRLYMHQAKVEVEVIAVLPDDPMD